MIPTTCPAGLFWNRYVALAVVIIATMAGACGRVSAPGSDAAPPDAPPPDAPSECLMDSHCDDDNPCTRDVCDADGQCQRSVIAGSCDDGDACTVNDSCDEAGQCVGEAMQCSDVEICDINTGQCVCAPGTLDCGGTCLAGAVCCPGAVGGDCGRCGTSRCNSNGQWVCTDETGVCTPGETCQYPNGACLACQPGQQKVCNEGSCNWGGCFP